MSLEDQEIWMKIYSEEGPYENTERRQPSVYKPRREVLEVTYTANALVFSNL